MQILYAIDKQIHPDARAIKAELIGDLNWKPFTECLNQPDLTRTRWIDSRKTHLL